MAVIKIKIVVANLENVMENFDVIKIYRSSTVGGTYAEITTPATRIPLVDDTIIYEFTDTTGDPDYYYKSSYYHSSTLLESSLSDAQQGEGAPALDIVSVDEVKTNYLYGLDLTRDDGTEYPDTLYEWFIKSAVSWLEHRLDIPIITKNITEEKHDFFLEDYYEYMWLKVKKYPIISVSEVKLMLPGDELVQNFDSDWFQVDNESGQVQILPSSGSLGTLLLGASGVYWPIFRGYGNFIPNAFRVSYTAGFDEVPDVIKDLVGKIASFGPLNIAGDLLGGAGIASQSLSIDGLSQSFNTTSSSTSAGYGARLLQYSNEIKQVIPTLERYYKGLRLTVI